MKTRVTIDTNTLLLLQRNAAFVRYMHHNYPIDTHRFVLPFATEGEGFSFVIRGSWGTRRREYFKAFLDDLRRVREVSDEMIQAYAEIDAYTLCQHPTLKKPQGETAHRMGKNDLWIAATTYVHADRIVTTDQDFIQLDGVFFPVDYIDISEFTGRVSG